MKKGFILGLATGLTVAGASLVLANSQIQAILNDQIKVTLNGQVQEFKDETTNETQYPITYKDRTYLPLRAVANLVGVDVDYDVGSNTAILKSDKDTTNKMLNIKELIDNYKSNPLVAKNGDVYELNLNPSTPITINIKIQDGDYIIMLNDKEIFEATKYATEYSCIGLFKDYIVGIVGHDYAGDYVEIFNKDGSKIYDFKVSTYGEMHIEDDSISIVSYDGVTDYGVEKLGYPTVFYKQSFKVKEENGTFQKEKIDEDILDLKVIAG